MTKAGSFSQGHVIGCAAMTHLRVVFRMVPGNFLASGIGVLRYWSAGALERDLNQDADDAAMQEEAGSLPNITLSPMQSSSFRIVQGINKISPDL